MPYLPLDLEAKKKLPKVARAIGTTPGELVWGLMELWEHVWLEKNPIAPQWLIDGCFGPDKKAHQTLAEAGFLEWTDAGWRVRGADRFLNVSKARSEAGKKGAGNLKQNRRSAGEAEEAPPAPSRQLPSNCPAIDPGLTPTAHSPTPDSKASLAGEPSPQRVGAFRDCIEEIFRQERQGAAYAWTHADEAAVRKVTANANDVEAEVLRRFRLMLQRTRYPMGSTLVDLSRNWNAYAAPEPIPIRPAEKPRTEAAKRDPNRPTGVVANEF